MEKLIGFLQLFVFKQTGMSFSLLEHGTFFGRTADWAFCLLLSCKVQACILISAINLKLV